MAETAPKRATHLRAKPARPASRAPQPRPEAETLDALLAKIDIERDRIEALQGRARRQAA